METIVTDPYKIDISSHDEGVVILGIDFKERGEQFIRLLPSDVRNLGHALIRYAERASS